MAVEAKTILFLEGDHLQYGGAVEALETLPGLHFRQIDSESGLIKGMPDLIVTPPDLVIAEVLFRWSSPLDRPAMPQTPEAIRYGYSLGGIRCLAMLRAQPETAHVPSILWTYLERRDLEGIPDEMLPSGIDYIQKHIQNLSKLRDQVARSLNID